MAAEKTSGEPTKAPVWERAARDPAGRRPDLTTITGLRRAAARSALMKRRAFRIPSTYSRMQWLWLSRAR